MTGASRRRSHSHRVGACWSSRRGVNHRGMATTTTAGHTDYEHNQQHSGKLPNALFSPYAAYDHESQQTKAAQARQRPCQGTASRECRSAEVSGGRDRQRTANRAAGGRQGRRNEPAIGSRRQTGAAKVHSAAEAPLRRDGNRKVGRLSRAQTNHPARLSLCRSWVDGAS